MADLAHLVLLHPLPHPLHHLLPLLALERGVLAEVSEGHPHGFVLEIAVGYLDVVLAYLHAFVDVQAEKVDRLQELYLAVVVPDSYLWDASELVVRLVLELFERGRDLELASSRQVAGRGSELLAALVLTTLVPERHLAIIAVGSQVGLLSLWYFVHGLELIRLVTIFVAVAAKRRGIEVVVRLFLEIREEGVCLIAFFLLLNGFLLGFLHELIERSRSRSVGSCSGRVISTN